MITNLHWTIPPILQGIHVTLEPLQREHGEELLAAASDGELWNLWYTTVPGPETVRGYIAKAMEDRDRALLVRQVLAELRLSAPLLSGSGEESTTAVPIRPRSEVARMARASITSGATPVPSPPRPWLSGCAGGGPSRRG